MSNIEDLIKKPPSDENENLADEAMVCNDRRQSGATNITADTLKEAEDEFKINVYAAVGGWNSYSKWLVSISVALISITLLIMDVRCYYLSGRDLSYVTEAIVSIIKYISIIVAGFLIFGKFLFYICLKNLSNNPRTEGVLKALFKK